METAELLCIAQIVIVIAVMIPACYCDWKYREIPDKFWWMLGIAGIAFCVYHAYDSGMCWQYVTMILGTVMILIDILWDVDRKPYVTMIFYAVMIALFAAPIITTFDDPLVKQFTIIPAYFVIFYLFYVTGLVKGGADTKCLIVMAMMFQTYPRIDPFPLIAVPTGSAELLLAFPLALLFHAALFSLFALFWIVLRKLHRKDDPVTMYTLSWYKMSIAEARKSHVWSKQDAVDGMVVNVRYIPDEGVYDRLEAAGAKDVWVTPIIPFIIPILASFVFIVFVGSLLFIPFSL